MKFKLKFEPEGQPPLVVTIDTEANTFSAEDGSSGRTVTTPGSRTLEVIPDGAPPIVFTFEEPPRIEPGHAQKFVSSVGGKGVATYLGPV